MLQGVRCGVLRELDLDAGAPSMGYIDAALAVSPFDNSRAADFSVQLLLALGRMEAASIPFSSKLHQSVSETLRSMQVPHINEVPVFGG